MTEKKKPSFPELVTSFDEVSKHHDFLKKFAGFKEDDIKEIWKDDEEMAEHLAQKYPVSPKSYHFYTRLDGSNKQIFVEYFGGGYLDKKLCAVINVFITIDCMYNPHVVSKFCKDTEQWNRINKFYNKNIINFYLNLESDEDKKVLIEYSNSLQ